MKAIQIIEPGIVKVIDIEKPVPGPGEVLLKIKYVGFCGSDLSTYLGKNPMVSYPRIPGHEIAAVIDCVGPDVPDNFCTGQKLTVIPYTHCGNCVSCKRGRYNACENNQTLGVQRDGAMAEFITIAWEKLLPAPALTEIELALTEPLTVGFHAVDRGSVDSSDIVMVIGCGMIGAGAILGAAKRNAKVIAVDIDDEKLSTAMAIGATYAINSAKTNLHDEIQNILTGGAPDVVVEAVGNPATYKVAIEEVAFSGRVVCIGYAKNDINFTTKLWVQKELDISGSRNATPENFREVISMFSSGKFPSEEVITRIVKPDEAISAFQEWKHDPGKVFKLILSF